MSQRVRYVLIGVGMLVFVVVVWLLVLSPIRGHVSATNTSIQDQQTKLQQAKGQLALAKATQEEGQRNQAELLELAKMIPNDEELPSLLLQLQDLADQSGIDFTAITPGDPVEAKSGNFQLVPLSMNFTGTFFDVSDFIYRAEQMVSGPGRLLALKSLGLTLGAKVAGGTSPDLTVTLSLYAFTTARATATPGSAGAATQPAGATTSTTAAAKQ